MLTARYHLFETEAGLCGLGWNDAGLTQVQLPDAEDHFVSTSFETNIPKCIVANH